MMAAMFASPLAAGKASRPPLPLAHRRALEEQLRRLGRRSMDLWVLRGFSEPAVTVEDTMAVVKVGTRVRRAAHLAVHRAQLLHS